MKTPKVLYTQSMLISIFCLITFLFSCEKAAFTLDQPVVSTDVSTKVNASNQNLPFQFALTISHCFAGGIGVTIEIENPREYAFLWEINGKHGGHDLSTLPCLCGDSATVYVTRLADQVKVHQSIALPACNADIK